MRWISVVAGLSMMATPVASQEIDSPYRFVDQKQHVGAFAGYIFTDPGSLELGPEAAPVFGARYGLRVSGPFSIEGSAAYLSTARAVRDTTISASLADTVLTTVGSSDLSLAMLNANLRFDLTGPRTWNRLMPFIVFGVGAVFTISDEENDDDVAADVRYNHGTALVGDFGAGVEWFPLERWSVRIDARDVLWKIERPLGLRALNVADDEWVQNFLFTGGVSWRF